MARFEIVPVRGLQAFEDRLVVTRLPAAFGAPTYGQSLLDPNRALPPIRYTGVSSPISSQFGAQAIKNHLGLPRKAEEIDVFDLTEHEQHLLEALCDPKMREPWRQEAG